MSNDEFHAGVTVAVLVEAGVAGWALARRRLTAVVLLNGLIAAGVLFYNAPDLGLLLQTLDQNSLLLLAVELVTLATSAFWFAYPAPPWLVWTQFSIHALVSLAFLIFAFTFKLDRLI